MQHIVGMLITILMLGFGTTSIDAAPAKSDEGSSEKPLILVMEDCNEKQCTWLYQREGISSKNGQYFVENVLVTQDMATGVRKVWSPSYQYPDYLYIPKGGFCSDESGL